MHILCPQITYSGANTFKYYSFYRYVWNAVGWTRAPKPAYGVTQGFPKQDG